jgi:hypothetical protein
MFGSTATAGNTQQSHCQKGIDVLTIGSQSFNNVSVSFPLGVMPYSYQTLLNAVPAALGLSGAVHGPLSTYE